MSARRATLAVAAIAVAACARGTAFDLGVGDCFQHTTSDEVVDIDTVDCDEPHDNEVFHTFEVEGDEGYPGLPAIEAAVADECFGDAFEDYVGVPYSRSEVEVYPITPTEDSWERSGDREVTCVASLTDQRIEGTLRGSGR